MRSGIGGLVSALGPVFGVSGFGALFLLGVCRLARRMGGLGWRCAVFPGIFGGWRGARGEGVELVGGLCGSVAGSGVVSVVGSGAGSAFFLLGFGGFLEECRVLCGSGLCCRRSLNEGLCA